MTGFGPLVETEWLAAQAGAPDIVVLDATWFLPNMERDGRAEFSERHIAGARYFDIDEVADQESGLPHMLPRAEDFAAAVGGMGIGNVSRVVVYDTMGAFSAPRVWWMFRVFGHDDVAVLNGGLHKWLAEGRPVTDEMVTPAPAVFTARLREEMVRSVDDMQRNLESRAAQVADTRGAGRFDGSEPEVRPGIRSGHIPGAVNVPYDALLDPASRTFLPPDALRALFADAGVDVTRPIITSCGSGVTACVMALGLELIGHEGCAVYDGSWTEWGGRADLPLAP